MKTCQVKFCDTSHRRYHGCRAVKQAPSRPLLQPRIGLVCPRDHDHSHTFSSSQNCARPRLGDDDVRKTGVPGRGQHNFHKTHWRPRHHKSEANLLKWHPLLHLRTAGSVTKAKIIKLAHIGYACIIIGFFFQLNRQASGQAASTTSHLQ